MADWRALTIQAGNLTQIQDGDNLVVGSGVKTLAGALTVNAATTIGLTTAGVAVGTVDGGVAGSTLLTLTQPVNTSGTPKAIVLNGGAHTTLTASVEVNDVNLALNRIVQFNTGAIATQRAVFVQAPTYAFVGASTITTAGTLSVSGPPVAGTNAVITNNSAILVSAGNIRMNTSGTALDFNGSGSVRSVTANGAITILGNLAAATATSDVIVNTSASRTAGQLFTAQNASTARFQVQFHGGLTVNQSNVATGVPQLLALNTGAHTNLTAGTEINFVSVSLNATIQWATGAIANQRCVLFQRPTLAFVGASTITKAATVAINNAPLAGANATITNSYAFWVQGGTAEFDGVNSIAINQANGVGTPAIGINYTAGAHISLPASVENPDVQFSLARTVQFATGALATQRAVLITPPTYAFVGASTITTAATLAVTGAPVAGTNATITNAFAVDIGGASRLNDTTAGNVAFWQMEAGQSSPVSPASTGRLRYNATTNTFQISQNGGAYVDILGSSTTTQVLSATTYTVPGGTAVNDLVYSTGADTASDSNATSTATMPAIGFVQAKPTGTTATLIYAGELGGFSGLTAGATYYASASTPGGITATAPSGSGNVVQRVGVARNTTTLVVEIDPTTNVI